MKQLALAYTNYNAEQISEIERVTEFHLTDGAMNRRLPAYRVHFDAGNQLEVYVDPVTGELTSASNATTRIQQKLFAYLHTWSFLGNESSTLRVTLVSTFIALAA